MRFRLFPLRFCFLSRDSVRFPPGQSANILRGAFGTIFRQIACVPGCPGARTCELRQSCPYARMFEPTAVEAGPSGFADWPRPFVFRAAHLDGCLLRPGQPFHFDMNLFDMRSPAISHLVRALSQLALQGLGPGRGRAELTGTWQLDAAGAPSHLLREEGGGAQPEDASPIVLDLRPPAEPCGRAVVRFLSPTELKSGQGLAHQPEFGVLAGRIRDRLSKLKQLYDDGPLEMDFRGFGERAAAVRLVRYRWEKVELARRSSRGGVHPIGGYVGEAEYAGELGEFLPFLKAARWTGVGRQTVWGKGEIELVASS